MSPIPASHAADRLAGHPAGRTRNRDLSTRRPPALISGFAPADARGGSSPVGREAKAWSRIGDRRQTEVALDQGGRLLEALPYPENLDNHFVVDPAKFDLYAMDCYRHLGEDKTTATLAEEVIRASTDFDGTERVPMRVAEVRITLGVAAARQGDIKQAVRHGERALNGQRKSLPSLVMVGRDLARMLNEHYSNDLVAKSYIDHLHARSSMSD